MSPHNSVSLRTSPCISLPRRRGGGRLPTIRRACPSAPSRRCRTLTLTLTLTLALALTLTLTLAHPTPIPNQAATPEVSAAPQGPACGEVGLQTGVVGLQTGVIGLQTDAVGLQTGAVGLQTGVVGLQASAAAAGAEFALGAEAVQAGDARRDRAGSGAGETGLTAV